MTTHSRRHHVLRDRRHDHRLRRDGFVTFPLIAREEAETIRRGYEQLDPPPGSGFVADLNITDRGYRSAANALISSSLDAPASAVFQDHEPFLRAFLCKNPGPDSGLYLHRDWMYVDERQARRATYVCWVALCDITGDNGQLRVVRSSHTIDHELRGTDLNPPWMRHQGTLGERLLTVPVRAGDCVVFNNALVHSSYPNFTDTPRLVAAVGFKPRGAGLVHFRRVGPNDAVRYDVDEDFFLAYSPGRLIEAPPDLASTESTSVTEHDLTEAELAARLDRSWLARLDRRQRRLADHDSARSA